MTPADFDSLPDNAPVLCADGAMALLIRYPSLVDPRAGVQVRGEENIRWIGNAELTRSAEGAMRQAGGPTFPRRPDAHDTAHVLIATHWISLGGLTMDRPLGHGHLLRDNGVGDFDLYCTTGDELAKVCFVPFMIAAVMGSADYLCPQCKRPLSTREQPI